MLLMLRDYSCRDTAAAAYEVFSTTRVTSPMLNKVIQHAVAIVS